MTKENQNDSQANVIESLVNKAKEVGFDEVPESTSELETSLILVMKGSGKIHTAKQMFETLGKEKTSKWFSDKMWNLAKKGVLLHLDKRGFYQYNKDY